ncbi:MAG: SDR family oxidoreductase [Gammaproteobacteria bacterium]|nr:SDR family oxidoreductase [Gammaproteobacteria bacterium]
MSNKSSINAVSIILSGLLLLGSVLLSSQPVYADGHEEKIKVVLVAGATGGTGREVVKDLLANGYEVRAFVRNAETAREKLGDDVEYIEGDVRDRASIDAALPGVDAIISAIGAGRGNPDNGPEFVDYGGVKNLAEAAAGTNIKQLVLVSSMGVTHEDHFLNKMFDNVLIWKLKGEDALRASGVPYTVVRPGGLVNKAGGEKVVVFAQGDEDGGAIPRADVARVCVAALGSEAAMDKTFEINSGKGPAQTDFESDFSALAADAN